MKIRYVRSDNEVAETYKDHPAVVRCARGLYWWPVGAVVDVDEDGARLVSNGDAEPADDEMEALCCNWKANRAEVLLSREMLAKGIEPEDRERFRRKEILGYDENGNDIPGPNYIQPDEEDED